MKGLYVLGGRQKRALLRNRNEWTRYEGALILQVDPDTGEVRTCAEYDTPPEARAGAEASMMFKAGTLGGDRLYVCTSTEVLIYQAPQFEVVGYISLPCFNDLHHVCLGGEGRLLAASTGLDMVVEFTEAAEVLRVWNVLGEDPWGRFSKDVDYRRVATTKPHRAHPNYIFHLGTDIWVTRFEQQDAVCLTRQGRRIAIGLERVHDGNVQGDSIYFTTVDGRVVIADRHTLQVSSIVDLNRISGASREPLGWCRGLWLVDDSRVWVGFSRIRETRFMENLAWVKRALDRLERPSHIALYDLAAGQCLHEIELESRGLSVIFSILPAVESRSEPRLLDADPRLERLAEVP
ncbi:MAG TPA: hypothetical protein VL523_02980 [Terriglobia bacterium]|nr:hypothetical protein [Terriglobia bacterium]